ncbi:hypothetical protein F4679DRAFT_537566 [Xylaria curta]|nr:hypothetical protein F4679DRAFT_537566 [Xylaria curta]
MSNSSPTLDSQQGYIMQVTSQHTDDVELAEKSLPPEAVFLQVIDAPFDGTKPVVRGRFNSSQDIYERMKNIPSHDSGVARILDVTIHSDFLITGLRETKGPPITRTARASLIRFLRETYTTRFDSRRVFRWLNDPLLVNDIGSISSQWSQLLDDSSTHFYRLVNRTSLQQDPLDFDLHPRDSYLTCAQDDKNRLIVIIVNDVWFKQGFKGSLNKSGKEDTFDNPRTFLNIEKGTSWSSFSGKSLERFARLLILDFFEASIYLQPVDYYEKLIYPQVVAEKKEGEVLNLSHTKNPHLQVPLGLFEPRLSVKSREAFKEIKDAEGILRSVENLVDSIDYVLEMIETLEQNNASATKNNVSVTQNNGPVTQLHERPEYKTRKKNLQKLCEERKNNAERALNALNRQLDYLTKRHAIGEAKAIRILTILASVYLPLSLAASLLGMQSPLKDIAHDRDVDDDPARLNGTNLLFDFVGIFVVLATATVFIVCVIRLWLYLHMKGSSLLPRFIGGAFSILDYGKRWRFDGKLGIWLKWHGILTKWFTGGVFGIVLLVIFLRGSLYDAQGAWDVAKYFFTAYAGAVIVFCLSYVGLYIHLYRKNLGGRWSEILRHKVLKSTS